MPGISNAGYQNWRLTLQQQFGTEVNPQSLGRLESVPLRNVWGNEARDFTPWLAEPGNLLLLGETLGLELEFDQREKSVGRYSADIVCRDTSDDTIVLIENQLEATNHNHLGQILTYAAGLNARTVIWITERFVDEHRAALDWLNERTTDDIQFFGLEIELFKIGDSNLAPKFNVVVKPNAWIKSNAGFARAATGDLSQTRVARLEFWRGFEEFLRSSMTTLKIPTASDKIRMDFPIGVLGVTINAVASSYNEDLEGYDEAELRAQLTFHGGPISDYYYDALFKDCDEIEIEFGHSLQWYSIEGTKRRRIYIRKTARLDEISTRQENYDWLRGHLHRMYEVFVPRIKDLQRNKHTL